VNAHELNQRLCDQMDAVLGHLFPAGKKVRGEFCVGGLQGQAGDSLKIHLGGTKKGYWCDFATNERGRSLLGLWAEVAGGDFAKACGEAKRFLGISDDYEKRFYGRDRAPKKEAPPVMDRSRFRALTPGGAVLRYLVDERKIDEMAVRAYHIAESADGGAVVFPFFASEETPEGEKLAEKAGMVKFLKIARAEGKKEIWTLPAGVTDCLFGKRVTLPKSYPKGVVVITEGELDALSVACYGYHGVSVPRGAKAATADGKSANDQWIEADFQWLANFERIYLWLDDDEPGRKAARDIAQRIGLERCFIVTTPAGHKDANECLCAEVPPSEIAKAFDEAVTLDPANLQWAGQFEDKVFKRLFPPGGIEPGVDLPWPFPWKIRPGEMTVWTGFDGHGKTVLLSQLMVHLAAAGERICTASMEVEPDKTLETYWCQANGSRMPWDYHEGQNMDEATRLKVGEQRFRERYAWLADRFMIFLPETGVTGAGRADWRKMIECFVYARQRYGATQFAVDSLMMCVGRSEEEFREVETFVNALKAFVLLHQVHVHLVAHSRKKDDENKPPGKQDIAGPKETSGISHNVAVVHRNMAKSKKWQMLDRELKDLRAMVCLNPDDEAERKKNIADGEKELAAVKTWHDGELHLLKQRNGDGELGSKYLFFNTNARQFVEDCPWSGTRTPESQPRIYIPRGADTALPSTEELSRK
jgi:twinkle protein